MKLIFTLLLFAKLNSAFQLYNSDGFNLTSPEYYERIYTWCNFDGDLHPNNISVADIFKCRDSKVLYVFYCEPPKILDESNKCVSEIGSEEWQKVIARAVKLLWPITNFVYLDSEFSNSYGKVRSKRVFTETVNQTFVAVGKTAEGEYKLFEMDICYSGVEKYKCADDDPEPDKSDTKNWPRFNFDLGLPEFVLPDFGCRFKMITPSLISIVCFLILLIFFTVVEINIFEKCMINFLSNSLIKHLTTVLPFLFASSLDLKILNIIGLSFVAIIIYTKYSLYFWLNITFFEFFYRFRFENLLLNRIDDSIKLFFRTSSDENLLGRSPKRSIYYYLIGYLLPIVIPVIITLTWISVKNSDFTYDMLYAVLVQKTIPDFQKKTRNFVNLFDLFDIIVKLLTLCVLLGSILFVWKNYQKVKNSAKRTKRPQKKSKWKAMRYFYKHI